MACFAALLERSLVWIDMAGRASVKLHVPITDRTTLLVGLVAFLARHLNMQAGQWVPCFRVVKLRGLLPVIHVVTTLAVASELALMRIGVARYAVCRQAEEGLRLILRLDELPLARHHFRGRVAFFAR